MSMSLETKALIEALVEHGHSTVEVSLQKGEYTVVLLSRKVKSKEPPVED